MKEFLKLLTLTQEELAIFVEENIPQHYNVEVFPQMIVAYPKNWDEEITIPTFSAHLDIVGSVPPTISEIVVDKTTIKLTKDAKASVLGGDDRCGVWIMLELMKAKKNAIFAFFFDEEIGCLGSHAHCNHPIFDKTNAFIGLDRRGGNDCALYGYDSENLTSIIENLGYKRAIGSITDVAVLAEYWEIPCINISVGFNNEHTKDEWIDFLDTKKALEACLNLRIGEEHFQIDSPVYSDEYEYYFDDDIPLEPVFCTYCGSEKNLYKLSGDEFICADCWHSFKKYM